MIKVTYFPRHRRISVGNVLLSLNETHDLIAQAQASRDRSPDTLLGLVNRELAENPPVTWEPSQHQTWSDHPAFNQ
jgi:hypothetical protein